MSANAPSSTTSGDITAAAEGGGNTTATAATHSDDGKRFVCEREECIVSNGGEMRTFRGRSGLHQHNVRHHRCLDDAKARKKYSCGNSGCLFVGRVPNEVILHRKRCMFRVTTRHASVASRTEPEGQHAVEVNRGSHKRRGDMS